jgi:lysophospholipase L1-like esterase
VYFAGTRVSPSAVGPGSITFTVPVRTIQTGFGSAGPAPVAILTQGRYVRAPSFTRYLSVLAVGDSLTFGVSNMYVGGVKVPVNVQRPYPRGVKTALEATPQFGQYALVSNAGWPGEWVTQGGFNQSPGAITRSARCTAGQANCFYFQSPDPHDYFTPHDVAVLLEGVNDLNNGVAPSSVQRGMGRMVIDAKAKGLQVLLALFGPYGIDEQTGQQATFPDKVREYNDLLDALAVDLSASRERVHANMGPDGLHPTQTGYDEMADTISRKLLAMFPRCAAGLTACP